MTTPTTSVWLDLRETVLAAIENQAPFVTDEFASHLADQIVNDVTVREIELINPLHLVMTLDGLGLYPDGYSLTESGREVIKQALGSHDATEES